MRAGVNEGLDLERSHATASPAEACSPLLCGGLALCSAHQDVMTIARLYIAAGAGCQARCRREHTTPARAQAEGACAAKLRQCAAGLCGARCGSSTARHMCAHKCTATTLSVSIRAAAPHQGVSLLPRPRKSSHTASCTRLAPAGHGVRTGRKRGEPHLPRRVPAPRHPQRPQHAAVRRAPFAGSRARCREGQAWCGEAWTREKSKQGVFRELRYKQHKQYKRPARYKICPGSGRYR